MRHNPKPRPSNCGIPVVPGFLCKITPAGRKVFMLQYRTNAGERRKPALGQYGELTVDQARTMAQEWLAEVRKGGDPSAAKNAARKAPTMKEFCHTFMEDYSKQRNKPSTQRGYQGVIDRCIIPIMGRMKVQDGADVSLADRLLVVGVDKEGERDAVRTETRAARPTTHTAMSASEDTFEAWMTES